jgi:hypothetical protein
VYTDAPVPAIPGGRLGGDLGLWKQGEGAVRRRGEYDEQQDGADGRCFCPRSLKEPCAVKLYSDSKYIVDAVELGWLKAWQARGWKKSDNDEAKNLDCGKGSFPC